MAKKKQQLEKRLALGMALVNGANTFAPVALLYTNPNLLLGKQIPLDYRAKQVALRMSAEQERKPYSCANLQSLAYAAMSAVDGIVFGKAEARMYDIDSAGAIIPTITSEDIVTIYPQGAADVVIMSSGFMTVYAGGSANVGTVQSGTQYIYGLCQITEMSGGTQYVSGNVGSAGITSMFGGFQEIGAGGTGTVEKLSGGTQLVAGTVKSTTVYTGGTQILWQGATLVSNTLVGGSQIVVYGAQLVADSTTTLAAQAAVLSNGTQVVQGRDDSGNPTAVTGFILSGGTVDGRQVGGTQIASAYGIAVSTTIASGGVQLLFNDGSATHAEINSGGIQNISAYGSAVSTNINSGGVQNVSADGRAFNTEINSGGVQNISANGSAVSTNVNFSGIQNISAGGSAVSTNINSGGVQNVSSGGTVATAIVGEGGTQVLYSCGTLLSNTLAGGTQILGVGVQVISDKFMVTTGTTAYFNQSALLDNGTQILRGAAGVSNTAIAGYFILSGGTVNGEATSGVQVVSAYGLAYRTSVYSGGTQIVDSSGCAEETYISVGGTQQILAGGTGQSTYLLTGGFLDLYKDAVITDLTWQGGTEILNAGVSVANTSLANGGIVLRGTPDEAATATSVTLSGGAGSSGTLTISTYGIASATIVNSGGVENISAGGTAEQTTVNASGVQNILSNGLADGAIVNKGGTQNLYGGGTALNNTVSAGGTQNVLAGAVVSGGTMIGIQNISSGGSAVSETVDAEGQQEIYAGGAATAVTINGGLQEIFSGGKATVLAMNGGTQLISNGGVGSVAAMNGGSQLISSGGVGLVSVMSDGRQGIVDGGTGKIDTMAYGVQVINGYGSIGTMDNGGQYIYSGSGSIDTLNRGMQIIQSGATGAIDTMNSGSQVIGSGASGSITIMQSGKQGVKGIGSINTMSGGIQNISSGGTGSIAALSEGTQAVFEGGTAISTTLNGGTQLLSSGATAVETTLNGGTQLLNEGAFADATTVNSGGTMQLNGTTSSTVNVSVGTVNANNGNVVLGTGTGANASAVGNVLTIATLNGSANFIVNTDIANGNSDKIIITSATNSTANSLKINYDPSYAVSGSSTTAQSTNINIISAPLSVKFTAATTDWGAIRFTPSLTQNADGNWYLTTGISNGTDNGTSDTSASDNTMTAADSHQIIDDAWFTTVNSLSKRLGDLRLGKNDSDNGIWARYMRATNRAGRGRKAELNGNLMQFGYDRNFAVHSGTGYLGIAVDHLNGGSVYETGSGTAKATSVALYNTWLGKRGHYYDVILRQGHFSNDYALTDLSGTYSKAAYGINATTLSGEYGYRKSLKHGMYLEPEGEIIYGHLTGTDYTTSLGWPVHLSTANHFLTRIGLAMGQESSKGSWYGKVSYYHDFGSSGTTTFADYGYSRKTLRDWVEITLGGDVKLSKSMNLYGEATKYLGDLTNNINFNAGLRWNF